VLNIEHVEVFHGWEVNEVPPMVPLRQVKRGERWNFRSIRAR
jgi:hypothetical protein